MNSRDLPFAAGSVGGVTSVTIVIEILNDDIVEADEMFTVTISTSDQDATITADTAVVTITEDPADCNAMLTFFIQPCFTLILFFSLLI